MRLCRGGFWQRSAPKLTVPFSQEEPSRLACDLKMWRGVLQARWAISDKHNAYIGSSQPGDVLFNALSCPTHVYPKTIALIFGGLQNGASLTVHEPTCSCGHFSL